MRRKGKSLAEIARHEISPLAGVVGSIAILIIIIQGPVLGYITRLALANGML